MIQADVYKVLSESSSIREIVASRIYPIELPQGVNIPAIVYVIPDITPVKSLDGESGLDIGVVEITCWAKDYSTAHVLAAAVRSAFIEAGTGIVTGNMQDTRDEETRAYGVVVNMSAWSISAVGTSPQNLKNPIASMSQAVFTGDGTTTEFTLPKFRAGSLLIFFNGRLAKKGLQSDLTAAYWENATHTGFVFRVAPQGGDYADELLAYYAAN